MAAVLPVMTRSETGPGRENRTGPVFLNERVFHLCRRGGVLEQRDSPRFLCFFSIASTFSHDGARLG